VPVDGQAGDRRESGSDRDVPGDDAAAVQVLGQDQVVDVGLVDAGAVDGGTQRVLKYDLNGNYKYGWGGAGERWGEFEGPHQFTVDQEGNLYVAEVFNGRVQKFKPKPGADPAKIVGQELRYKAN